MFKVWVDKNREPPAEYIWARTVNEAWAAIFQYEHQHSIDTIEINTEATIGEALVDWFKRYHIVDVGYFFHVHGAQPKKENLEYLIHNYGWRLI